ncbi:MAG: hypothetical protein HRT82_17670 [Henriciella sp.]|nr:hypothetical protein [Henriciella sp.]
MSDKPVSKFQWALLGASVGCLLTMAGLFSENDIVTGTGLTVIVGAVGFGSIPSKPK